MERDELIAEIKEAFSGVTLGDGIGLFEAYAIDNYETPDVRVKERARDRETWTRWEDISDDVLVKNEAGLLHFSDCAGIRFFLPAYMIFAVANHDTSSAFSIDSTVYVISAESKLITDENEGFDESQKIAVAKFLRFMAYETDGERVDDEVALIAYESGWNEYDV